MRENNFSNPSEFNVRQSDPETRIGVQVIYVGCDGRLFLQGSEVLRHGREESPGYVNDKLHPEQPCSIPLGTSRGQCRTLWCCPTKRSWGIYSPTPVPHLLRVVSRDATSDQPCVGATQRKSLQWKLAGTCGWSAFQEHQYHLLQ